jgi:cytoskeletal protein CcmA (bactofilin family)
MIIKKNDKNGSTNSDINFIAKGVAIVGDMNCENDLRYDGNLTGNLKVNSKLVLGTESKIQGTVFAINADVFGKVDGDIEVKETLTLRSTAIINGDIKTNKIVIENGAEFNGTCIMSSKNSKSNTTNTFPKSDPVLQEAAK